MKALIRALIMGGVLLGFTYGASSAPPLSFKTFSELGSKAVDISANLSGCWNDNDPQEIIVVYFRDPSIPGSYLYVSDVNFNTMWVYWTTNEQDGEPSEVAVAKAADDTIPTLKWVPYSPVLHGTSPCSVLFPAKA